MIRAFLYACIVGISIFSCTVSQETLEKSLNDIAKADLADIISEIKERSADSLISGNPEYKIIDFNVFKGDSGRVYKAYAYVHFFYLNSFKLYQARKYRYNAAANFWDRYDIKLKHLYPKKNTVIDSLK